ncbi:MAG TPA: alpha-L-rhamnosidase [Acidobacteriaceae bacterium]|nr:alpha-L-rhamnosidase [Acidobacteriaceae bacterium]
MNRRQFVARGVLAAGWAGAHGGPLPLGPASGAGTRSFQCDDADLQRNYDAALSTLHGNITHVAGFDGPALVEGSTYLGIWLECAPQESLVFGEFGTEEARTVARNNHLAFFALQKEDGQLPCSIKVPVVDRKGGPGWAQIQMVVPIAATAWEVAQRTGDSELLEKAYAACGRWDAWLRRYRNTRGTGLCEGFCVYDTGMDHSTRWTGVPNACRDGDAKVCPKAPGLPRLCPDLSATVYGGRVALAEMAGALGKRDEAERWSADAEKLRRLIVEKLYDPHDAAFYDVDAENDFVRVRSAAMLRVLGEHVPDAALFETVWRRQVHNEKAFWPAYPLPSVAVDDPVFVRPIPRNSWGGASQALTALRAPRWMEHYGKPAELAWMMQRWVAAIRRRGAFLQQMDPLSGDFTPDKEGYSPAALVLLDFVWRLSGVREQGELVEWNLRGPAAGNARFAARVHGRAAELVYDGKAAELRLGRHTLARVTGVVRIMTTRDGTLRAAVGIGQGTAEIVVRAQGREKKISVRGNERVVLGE